MASHNYCVTGRIGLMPQRLYDSAYFETPVFLVESEREPIFYRHHEIERFFEEQKYEYLQKQSLSGFLKNTFLEIGLHFGWELITPALCIACLAVPFARTDGKMQMLWPLVIMLLGSSLVVWTNSRDFAPGLVLVIALVIAGFQRLWKIRIGCCPVGKIVVAAALSGHMFVFGVACVKQSQIIPGGWVLLKEMVLEELEGRPGRDLVVVKVWSGTFNLG